MKGHNFILIKNEFHEIPQLTLIYNNQISIRSDKRIYVPWGEGDFARSSFLSSKCAFLLIMEQNSVIPSISLAIKNSIKVAPIT